MTMVLSPSSSASLDQRAKRSIAQLSGIRMLTRMLVRVMRRGRARKCALLRTPMSFPGNCAVAGIVVPDDAKKVATDSLAAAIATPVKPSTSAMAVMTHVVVIFVTTARPHVDTLAVKAQIPGTPTMGMPSATMPIMTQLTMTVPTVDTPNAGSLAPVVSPGKATMVEEILLTVDHPMEIQPEADLVEELETMIEMADRSVTLDELALAKRDEAVVRLMKAKAEVVDFKKKVKAARATIAIA
ncbi:hypothetical protein GUJ93_ZPchr0012g20335 [Zizania palustris]|uniref:Uncharacterized protein n=1 Tax=Zizania palustris TaxID=103762 RepID=A0A8J5WV60_ZIZPA|nr:hypothetical protein GUJ93_ZPchr0012g20335 [Zizania palustris]